MITTATFNCTKVDMVAISDPFPDSDYMFHRAVKSENGKLVINGRAIDLQE